MISSEGPCASSWTRGDKGFGEIGIMGPKLGSEDVEVPAPVLPARVAAA